jgi:hypothetical protein
MFVCLFVVVYYSVKMWTGFSWLQIGLWGALVETNELSGSINGRKCLDYVSE